MLEGLYEQYKDIAEFFVVYIREAHPSDGWVVPQNVRQGISVCDPRSYSERVEVAEKACSVLRIKIPCLVDDMNDSVNQAYSAWPDRVYIVDVSGRIVLMGDKGPRGFAPSVRSTYAWLRWLASATRIEGI